MGHSSQGKVLVIVSVPSPERQIEFLTNVQRLLSEGLFVATYKYALLLALADIAVERGSDDDLPLEIPTRLIAVRFIQYYSRQSAAYMPSGTVENAGVLRQNTGNQAGIVRLLLEVRVKCEGSLAKARSNQAEWNSTVSAVDNFVRVMPLWRLQTVGSERLDFLYENSGAGRLITLKPGVAFCLRRYYPLVADLVKGAWSRYVRRFNPQLLGEACDLHEFLFGSERASLAAVAPILREFQQGECFYCRGPLKGENFHVDHFIPWSRYPVDLGHNFVLAHATCNAKKSDRPACADHLAAWVGFQERSADMLAVEFNRSAIPNEIGTSLRIANWAYTQTFECHGLTWFRGDELRALESDWNRPLIGLLSASGRESVFCRTS